MRTKIERKQPTWSDGKARLRILGAGLFFIGAALFFRLANLQVFDHGKWVALAENQHNASQPLSADRGEIYMHDGENLYPLAVNREYDTAYVVPKDITDRDHTALALADALGIDPHEILDKLQNPDDPFEIIKKRLTEDESAKVKALGLVGVGLQKDKYRYYPSGELAAQVVGFAQNDDKGGNGGYGIEASQNELLRGEHGSLTQETDAAGRWIPLSDRDMVVPKDGEKLVLTLDRVVQYETEKILQDSVEKYAADGASAIVMDPSTGKVLAMASVPKFDPNNYSKVSDYTVFMNPAVSFTYEPGSVMKPLTMAMGIEEGKVNPQTEYTDPGVVQEAGYSIHNAEDKSYGRSTMTKVLEQSINTGVIYVEKLVGNRTFADYMRRFGFGERTHVGLPAELPGNIKNLDNLRGNLQFFTASFGQGIAVTPLQLVAAYGALANRGMLMRPEIIDSIVHADGSVEKTDPVQVRQVVSDQTAEELGQMLRAVVTNGHGKRADVPGYLVGGKTGTAQVASGNVRGYQDGVSIGSFVGYAPINDPKFVVLVKLDNPKNVEWAESSAAPTFGEIMKFLLEYAKIQPTEEVNPKP